MEQTGVNMQILLRLMWENEMPYQAQELRKLLGYMLGMERQCGEILEELRQVRERLSKLEHSQHLAAAELIKEEEKVRSGVERVRDQLQQIKQTIEDRAKSVVEGFRRTGVSALQNASEVLDVRKLLGGVQGELCHAAGWPVEQRPEGRAQAAVPFTMRGVQKTLSKMQAATSLEMCNLTGFEQRMADQAEEVFALQAPEQERHTEADAPAFTMST